MSSEKHGIIGTVIKFCMVIIFTMIGAAAITVNSIGLAKHYDPQWYYIVNLVFGCCLLTAPFFLKKADRGILVKIIKVLMIIIFVVIGALYITTGSIGVAKNYDPKWAYIVHIVFGGLLFTSPFFLKK